MKRGSFSTPFEHQTALGRTLGKGWSSRGWVWDDGRYSTPFSWPGRQSPGWPTEKNSRPAPPRSRHRHLLLPVEQPHAVRLRRAEQVGAISPASLPCIVSTSREKTHAPLPRLGRTRLRQCGMAGAERRRGPPRPEGQRPPHRQRGEVHHGARGGAGGVRRGDDEGEELAVRGPQHVGAGRRRGSRGRSCGPWGWRFWLPLPNTKPRGGMILGVLGVVHTINPDGRYRETIFDQLLKDLGSTWRVCFNSSWHQ